MDTGQARLETLDLSDRLRLLMHHHQLTVAELADYAGVSKSAMEKYLAGPSSPRATAIAAICVNLGINSEWLLLGRPDEDVYLVHNCAGRLIGELLADLKHSGEAAEAFARLVPGTAEWRMFVLQLSDERALEIAKAITRTRRAASLAAARGERIATGDPMMLSGASTLGVTE